jgi:hypothetical protein
MRKWQLRSGEEAVHAPVIEGMVTGDQLDKENADHLAYLCHGRMVTEFDALDSGVSFVGINVPTRTGKRRASEGDYIVQDEEGNFHVFQKHVFALWFEEVDE